MVMIASTLLTARSTAQQSQERLLEKYIHRKEPVRIKAIKRKRGDANVGKKFLDDDDWLKGLSFNLENISGKNITYIQLELEFPRSDDVPPLVFPIIYGQGPLSDGSLPASTSAPIKPGEEVVLSLSDQVYAALQQVLEGQKYSKSIKHVILDIRAVLFDDGLMWRAGRLMRRDPADPTRWISVDRMSESGSTPNRGQPLSLGAKSLLSHAGNFFGVNFKEIQPSTGSPAPQTCDDYTTIVRPCSLSCNADDDVRPPNPQACDNIYCWSLKSVTRVCYQVSGMPNGDCAYLSKTVGRAQDCSVIVYNPEEDCANTGGSYWGGVCHYECGYAQAGEGCSPVLLDVSGNGFDLTSRVDGVRFDLDGDGGAALIA